MMRSSRWWWLVIVLAALISLYGLAYVVLGRAMYPPPLLASFVARPWGIYPHALFGGIALFAGALQFRRALLVRRPRVHRIIGTTYVASAVATGVAGGYMAMYAFGGWVTRVGFGSMAALTLWATVLAYRAIRRRDVAAHRAWTLRSYALLFAGVTLRLESPLLMLLTGDFTPAYRVVAWLSWVPNLLWAEWYLRRTAAREAAFVAALPTAPGGSARSAA
jgi:uncharacterized membrane protein